MKYSPRRERLYFIVIIIYTFGNDSAWHKSLYFFLSVANAIGIILLRYLWSFCVFVVFTDCMIVLRIRHSSSRRNNVAWRGAAPIVQPFDYTVLNGSTLTVRGDVMTLAEPRAAKYPGEQLILVTRTPRRSEPYNMFLFFDQSISIYCRGFPHI